MKLILTHGGVPAGSYVAKFVGVQPSEPNQYGPGLRWTFEIVAGPHAGSKVSKTTGTNPTPKNQAGKMLIALSGKTVMGEEIDLAACVGKNYLLVVVNRPEGGTAIESVSIPPVG